MVREIWAVADEDQERVSCNGGWDDGLLREFRRARVLDDGEVAVPVAALRAWSDDIDTSRADQGTSDEMRALLPAPPEMPTAKEIHDAARLVWETVPATHDPDDPQVSRHAEALNDLGQILARYDAAKGAEE